MDKKGLYLLLAVFLLLMLTPIRGLAGGAALYEQARKAYESFSADDGLKANRANWLKIIAKFERVYQEDPGSSAAPKAYFMAGKLSANCYKMHRNRADMERGRKNFEALLRKYPSNSMCDDAEYYLGDLYLKSGDKEMAAYHYKLAIERYPNGNMGRDARQRLEQMKLWPMPAWLRNYHPGAAPPPVANTPQTPAPAAPPVGEATGGSGRTLIKQIKTQSNGAYTRVVIYCKQKVRYTDIQYVKPNPAAGAKYPRMFMDILDSRLAPGVDRPQSVNDGLLLKVRAGQFTPDTVRVVLEIDAIDPDQTKVFPMEETGGDYRIVIDVSAPKKKAAVAAPTPKKTASAPPAPARKAIRRIVLDPGHGGKDPGAVGPNGLREKDVVLKVALETRKILKEIQGLDVRLTREKDVFLPLEERTGYANVVHIEDETLFVSIHANAADDERAHGIETYILDTTNDEAAKRLAAIENKVSIEAINRFQSENNLIFTLFQKAKADESFNLAMEVQKALVSELRPMYADVGDHGVKEAPFFVLMGAKMPCILVELSFISNPTEEKRLGSSEYQYMLAQSIAEGIDDYIRKKVTMTDLAHD